MYVTWELPYSSAYLSLYFSVRARALASLVSAVAQVVAALAFGAFLNQKRISLNKRAQIGYIFIMSLVSGCWIWDTIVSTGYQKHKPPWIGLIVALVEDGHCTSSGKSTFRCYTISATG